MDDIFLLVEHSRDLGEVQVLGWFSSEQQARDAAAALEWDARHNPELPTGSGRRYWVKGISRYRHSSMTLH